MSLKKERGYTLMSNKKYTLVRKTGIYLICIYWLIALYGSIRIEFDYPILSISVFTILICSILYLSTKNIILIIKINNTMKEFL